MNQDLCARQETVLHRRTNETTTGRDKRHRRDPLSSSNDKDKDGHAPRIPRHHECGRDIPETSRYRDDMAAEAEQSPLPGRSRFTTTWPSDTNPPGSRGRSTTDFQAGGTATGANATTQSGQEREMLQLATDRPHRAVLRRPQESYVDVDVCTQRRHPQCQLLSLSARRLRVCGTKECAISTALFA